MVKDVEIGFIEDCESWKLESRFFPSKVGGKPAWLDLENLPDVDTLQCGLCKKQLIFLCQVYAPYEEVESNFHRTLFIFICRNEACSHSKGGENIKVFRSTLPKENKFYSPKPPEETPYSQFNISEWVKLCSVCGCLAQKHCIKCKEVYCCREHQVSAWKEGHKLVCDNKTGHHPQLSKLLFPEYELTIEPEILHTNVVDEKVQLEEFSKLQEKGETGTMSDVPESELEAHALIVEDKAFANFQKRIAQDPEQVIRYQRGGTPLWIAKEPIPDSVPNCEDCQGPRQFEFQIMPQMLVMLEEMKLDWGVLCIYTCINSCTSNHSYTREFVFRQDVQ